MKIAFFSDNFYPELSGISDSILTTAKELAKRGHEIRFFAPTYSRKNYELLNIPRNEPNWDPNISVSRFFSFPFPTGTNQGRLVAPIGLRTLSIRKFSPDIIHAHLPFGVGLEGLFAARILRKPFIGTNHTPTSEFIRYSPIQTAWLEKASVAYTTWFYNKCFFVSSPAQAIIDEMRTYGFSRPGLPMSNPLHLSTFKPLPEQKLSLKKEYGFSHFTLLYAGRVAAEKRVDMLLKAVGALKDKLDIDVAIIGRGHQEDELRQLSKTLGIENRVHFLGFVKEEEEMNRIYNACDAFVMMSTAETQSIVTMHAMACRLPVLVARSWGLKEYVGPERGILIEPGNLTELTDKVLWLYENRKAGLALAEEGERYVARFSPEEVARKWEMVYEKSVKGEVPHLDSR